MKHCRSAYKLSPGFSLFELLIVLAIIGILTTLAFPLYSDYLIKARVIELFSAAQPAKLAVTENILAGVELDKIDTIQAGVTHSAYHTVSELKIIKGNILVIGNNKKLGIISDSTLQLVLKPILQTNHDVSWECGLTENTPTDFYKYVPTQCRKSLKIES